MIYTKEFYVTALGGCARLALGDGEVIGDPVLCELPGAHPHPPKGRLTGPGRVPPKTEKCPYCRGTGEAYDPQTGEGPRCPACEGTGVCTPLSERKLREGPVEIVWSDGVVAVMALPDGHLGVARRPGAPELSEKQILVHTLGGIAEQAAEITRFKKAVDEVEDILDAGLGVFDDWQHQVSHHTDTLAQNSLKLASMLTAIRDAVAEMRPVFDDDLESPKEGRHE